MNYDRNNMIVILSRTLNKNLRANNERNIQHVKPNSIYRETRDYSYMQKYDAQEEVLYRYSCLKSKFLTDHNI